MDELIKYIIKGAVDLGYSMSQRGYMKTENEHVKSMDTHINEYTKNATESINIIVTALLKQKESDNAK